MTLRFTIKQDQVFELSGNTDFTFKFKYTRIHYFDKVSEKDFNVNYLTTIHSDQIWKICFYN